MYYMADSAEAAAMPDAQSVLDQKGIVKAMYGYRSCISDSACIR